MTMEEHRFQDLRLDGKVAANAMEQYEPSRGHRKGHHFIKGIAVGALLIIWWQWHVLQFGPLKGQYEIESENQQKLVDYADVSPLPLSTIGNL